MRVRDIMSSPAIVVSPEASLKEVARLLAERSISAVPVVEGGRVCGILSKSDIVRREQAFEAENGRGPLGWLRRHAPAEHVVTARDAMTSPPLTVDPTVSAVGTAWLMTEHDAHHLPVVDRGEVVGMVTRSDLVRAFARSDEQIRAEIVNDVLPSLGCSPNDVDVTVVNGDVTLAGGVCDDLVAKCLPHAVRGVIGVVDVHCVVEAAHHQPLVDVVTPTL